MIQSILNKIPCVYLTLCLIVTGFGPVSSMMNAISFQVNETLYVGGTGFGNYSTIQSAIDVAHSGDTVFVYEGYYCEHIAVNKTIQLVGERRNSTIIDGQYDKIVISLNADNITFSGFTITNSGGFFNDAALFVQSNDTTISACRIYRSRVGIYITNSSRITISDCLFHTNGKSLQADHSYFLNILTSEFCYSGIGISLYKSREIRFDHIYAHENGIASVINASSDIIITHSASCDNNDNGGGIYFYNTHDVIVYNTNAIHSGAGFKLVNSTSISFDSCDLEYNTHFTFWIHDYSSNITINQCTIAHNLRHGIHITDSSCTIKYSNLYDNMIDSVLPKNSDVLAKNNYWGSPLGPVFSKGFRVADTIDANFGTITYYPWSIIAYGEVGTDWTVSDTFEKTIIHGYSDLPLEIPGIDTDKDGIPDWWEQEFKYDETVWDDHIHLDPDGDALNNLEECYAYSWGADPYQRDLFLEFDHISSGVPGASNLLPQAFINQMINRFAEHDIVLHVDQGELGGGEELLYRNNFDFCTLVDLYWDYFLHNDLNNPRKTIFHYGLICDEGPGNGFAFMGWAHLNSFCISANELVKNQPFFERGWLITCGSMHETGHTLGLFPDDFGGNDNHAAIKPKYSDFWYYRNYKSCMNYRYTYTYLNYSDGDHGKIDYDDWGGMEFDFFKNTHFEWPKSS